MSEQTVYGAADTPRTKIRTHHLQKMKAEGHKWGMLTAYASSTARVVVRGAPHALVVADMPFGSYEASPQQALASAPRFMKEAGAHAVKLEGGERVANQIATLSAAGIPGVAHI